MKLYPLWGFIEPLLDAVNWNKLAVPAGTIAIFTIAYYVSKKLAEKAVSVRLHELESQLKTETDAHALSKTTAESLKIQQAAHSATIEAQLTTIKLNESQLAQKQADYAKLLKAAQNVQREVLELREVKKLYEKVVQEQYLASTKIKSLEIDLISRDQQLSIAKQDLEAREKLLQKAERRMQKARRLSGYLIKAKALQARPKFKLLEERNRPIIAVAALKGGVGKTTLTAHLAGALARKGYRVLLVDLDLQGSLTGLMLPPGVIHEHAKQKRLMQDFFVKAMEDKTTTLTEYIVRSPQSEGLPGSIDIVPTSDRLAYAELNLTLGWLLKQGERDARFLLRRALHLKGANVEYDIVLLDCPPVLNISCANALAASDFLLIPTLLSAKSTERVPNLIRTVQDEDFVRHLNSHLRIMGVVANRARYAELKGQEAVNWNVNLPKSLAAIQNQNTKLFTTIVAQDVEISSNEEQYTHPELGGRAHGMFTQLLMELERELPDASRKP